MIPILSVSEFIEQINGIITGEFIIEGEVSQYKISQGKWIFFDLKDNTATVNCFATVYGLGTPLADGMKIRVLGYPKVYEKSGRFSLVVQKVELVGEGSLKKAYLLLKEKLTKEGLFAIERKRVLPEYPQKIGVIASRDSAAWGDFWRILNNRWSGVEVQLYHVAVQGEKAVEEIVQAFDFFNNQKQSIDVLVVIRGGGSLEDLAAFNDERVVRAVYGSRSPVVSGVGHERDESLTDLAADVRASTPSNAAEIVVPDRIEFLNGLNLSLEHSEEKLFHQITQKKRLIEQSGFVVASALEKPLMIGRNILNQFEQLGDFLNQEISNRRSYLLAAERLFKNVDPKRVLKRGFSITRNIKGQILRRANQVGVGDKIVVELGEGKIKGEVI
jgi:exodeoxyribonuclease VII large subunit